MFRKRKMNVIASISEAIQRIDCRVAMLLAMTMYPLNIYAQDNAQDYVPPPLFETPSYDEPAPSKPIMPKKIEEQRTAPSNVSAPKPTSKPAFKVKNWAKKSDPKTTISKKNAPPPPNYRGASSKGVVRGPKTMPSAPAKSVESEVLFEAPEGQNTPLLYQQPKTQAPLVTTKAPVKPIAKPVVVPKNVAEKIPPLPAFKTPEDGVLQSTLYFVSVTERLSDTNQKTIKHLIIPELQKNDKKRLLIQAYASSQKDVLNGDRRIALSRALNIRRFLVQNGINPSRLDVRALGANTNTQPLDRVELMIIS